MKYFAGWGSHIPVLHTLLDATKGSVLEMGTGIFSTPFLHWMCLDRELVSYENIENYFNMNKTFITPKHQIIFVTNWDEVPIEREWDVALIDHAPAHRRIDDIRRLANFSKFLVLHDTQPNENKFYRYDKIFPLFKFRYDYTKASPQTSVVSNFYDPADLFKEVIDDGKPYPY